MRSGPVAADTLLVNMPRKLKPKLLKVERYKLLPSHYKEKGFKQYTNKWEKTSKLIYIEPKKGSYICGHGLGVTVKTYQTPDKKDTHKALIISCLCCQNLKEKDKLSLYLPTTAKGDRCMEIGGAMGDIEVWKRLLLPIFGVKIKGAIKL